ncbi:MAG: hypothetical protein IBX57_01640 [Gammaproteobacteria bacterium]|nr:hypothetical protein [Gammaproteobacteria bacterium]
MTIRIAINGFGRMGKLALQAGWNDETQVKVLAWYDNEWGYVNRMIDLAKMIGQSL